MSARAKFNEHLNRYRQNTRDSPTVAILGHREYDPLFLEISTGVADFMSCEQSLVSLEFQRRRLAHFHYGGILVIRSPGSMDGFHFA